MGFSAPPPPPSIKNKWVFNTWKSDTSLSMHPLTVRNARFPPASSMFQMDLQRLGSQGMTKYNMHGRVGTFGVKKNSSFMLILTVGLALLAERLVSARGKPGEACCEFFTALGVFRRSWWRGGGTLAVNVATYF